MNKNKKYCLVFFSLTLFFLITTALTVIIADPYFHYHFPSLDLHYTLKDQRYQNDGILRHFEYNALIIGTSMTENFKTSEFDKLFNCQSIKTPFPGATYKEINDNIVNAISYTDSIKYVVRALDASKFYTDSEEMMYDDYPDYLTNSNIFDDVYYLFNKTTLFKNVLPLIETYSKNNRTITSFDDAYNWHNNFSFGTKVVLKTYERPNKAENKKITTTEEIDRFQKNINKNIVETVRNNPQIEFYYFIPPYSICYWDKLNQTQSIEHHLYGEKMIIESLLPYENVHLFSFNNNFDIVTNLGDYKDISHYSGNINSYILRKMSQEKYRLTKDNYQNYLQTIEDYYTHYDYDSLFQ